jgi:hypothetical protein
MSKEIQKTTSRNPLFPEGTFIRGDYIKIAKLAGVSRSTVVNTLVYQTRKNQQAIKAANKLIDFQKKEFKS